MIIDIHAHVCAAPELYQWKANQMSARGAHGFASKKFADDWVRDHPDTKRNLRVIDSVGTDVQFLSPRPFQLMHAEKPVKIMEAWAVSNHDYIAQQVKAFPNRFQGVCAIPQAPGAPITLGFAEIDRCVKDLGFIGLLIDTDPGEGDNSTPTLGDESWYPLWEKMVQLDLPGLIHSTGCKHGRENYSQHFISEESLAILSIVNSRVLLDFPKLKIIVSHGGGSVPYQIGRWQADYVLKGGGTVDEFNRRLSMLYFDTCLHARKSLELLLGITGSEHVMFGTENPGSGSAPNPETGKPFDDIKPLIDAIQTLTDQDRRNIFEDNARRLFSRLKIPRAQDAAQTVSR
ncbi:MAG TPA: amidohydrolase family protein [Bryobacteraceae bacterium]|jgi:4-oxalmesaconate hydratase|nr:amidohydrolase family protein [Bryobacteraceae bacterium]